MQEICHYFPIVQDFHAKSTMPTKFLLDTGGRLAPV